MVAPLFHHVQREALVCMTTSTLRNRKHPTTPTHAPPRSTIAGSMRPCVIFFAHMSISTLHSQESSPTPNPMARRQTPLAYRSYSCIVFLTFTLLLLRSRTSLRASPTTHVTQPHLSTSAQATPLSVASSSHWASPFFRSSQVIVPCFGAAQALAMFPLVVCLAMPSQYFQQTPSRSIEHPHNPCSSPRALPH